MAIAPTAAPAPAPMDAAPDDTPQRTVLCTVMDNGDGTVSLIMGDEPEEMEEMAEGEMPPAAPGPATAPGAPGAPMMAGMEGGGAAEESGPYNDQTLGDMLRIIMNASVEAMGGTTPGMEEADMVQAYNGGEAAPGA